jgi:hypothetical protein
MEKHKAIAPALGGTAMAYTRSGVPVIHFDASGHLTNYFEDIHERGQPGIPSRIVLSRISGDSNRPEEDEGGRENGPE